MKANRASLPPVLAPVLVLFAINVLNFYDRGVPAALAEPLRKEFNLNDTQLGLMGSVFIWIYAIVGVPLGRVADSWSRKKLLASGVVVWSSLTAVAAIAGSFPLLLLSRMGVGVGEAVCAPTGTSWLGDLFPASRRARVLALFMLGVPIGNALSQAFSGPIAQAWGWRAAMVVAALPALILVPALLRLREPERGASEAGGVDDEKGSIWEVLRIPTLWWIIASGVFLNFNMYAFHSFLPAFLSRVHSMSVAQAGAATGLVYLISGVGGGLAAGFLGDRIIRTSKNGRMWMAALISLVGAPFAYFGILQPHGQAVLALALMSIAYAAMNAYYGLVYSSIQDIVKPRQRGITMALYFMVMYLCGASFGPVLTGSLSDRFAREAMAGAGALQMTETFRAIGLQQAMQVIPVLLVALAAVLYLGSRTIVRDTIAVRELSDVR